MNLLSMTQNFTIDNIFSSPFTFLKSTAALPRFMQVWVDYY